MTKYSSRENLRAVMKSLKEVYTKDEILEALEDRKPQSKKDGFFATGIGQVQAVESRYGGNYPPGFDTRELD